MRNVTALLLLAICASSGQTVQSPKTQTHGWVLRYDGIGDVKVGMTLKEVNAALGAHFSEPKEKDEQTCFYVEPKQHPDTAIMVLNGRVGRVDIFAPDKGQSSTATTEGIRIGDSEFRVKKVYGGKVAVETHHYDPDGHYLNIESGNYELRFETDGKKVVSFYAGTPTAVAFVEGCS